MLLRSLNELERFVFAVFHGLERLDCLERPLVYVWIAPSASGGGGASGSGEIEGVVLYGRESNGGYTSIFFFLLHNLGLSSHYGLLFHYPCHGS